MNVGVGHEVRRAGSKDGEVGVVVRRFTAPMPDIMGMPEGERAHALNVWKGLPAQIAVFWQETVRVEGLLDTDVRFAHPGQTYRSGDFGFPIAAVETDGYCDLIVRDPAGQEVARIDWLDDPELSLGDSATHRQLMHRLIDAYCDRVDEARAEQDAERAAAKAAPAAS